MVDRNADHEHTPGLDIVVATVTGFRPSFVASMQIDRIEPDATTRFRAFLVRLQFEGQIYYKRSLQPDRTRVHMRYRFNSIVALYSTFRIITDFRFASNPTTLILVSAIHS